MSEKLVRNVRIAMRQIVVTREARELASLCGDTITFHPRCLDGDGGGGGSANMHISITSDTLSMERLH